MPDGTERAAAGGDDEAGGGGPCHVTMVAGDGGIAVAGFRGAVGDLKAVLSAVARVEGDAGVSVQLLDASRVHGGEHLAAAHRSAVRATAAGRGRADSLKVEMVRYAAGMHQIGEALSFMGIGKGKGAAESIAAVAWTGGGAGPADADAALSLLGQRLGWTRDDAVLAGDRDVLRAFGVSDEEVALVGEENGLGLILERVAMADLRR